jgi:outer membrane lipoprotein-sorting protein
MTAVRHTTRVRPAAGARAAPVSRQESDMYKRMGLLGVVLAFTAATAVADELESATKRITEAWQKHKTLSAKVTLSSRIEAGGMLAETTGTGTFEHGRRGEKPLVRMELKTKSTQTMGGQTSTTELPMTTIIDGEYAYVVTEIDGKKSATKSTIDPQSTGDPAAMLAELKKEKNVKLLPEETMDGRKLIVIEATPKQPSAEGTVREVYSFDEQTGLLAKMVGLGPDAKPIMELTYTDIKVDVEINPDRFKKPEGVEMVDQTRRAP